MKVCHLTSAHASNDVRIFKKECCSLVNAGYDVSLVARGESRVESSVKVVGIGQMNVGRLKRMFGVSRSVYEHALQINADVYHIHDPELLLYALKLKKKGKKVIFDSHEDVVDSIKEKEYLPLILRNVISNIYESFQNYVLSRVDAVISVTPHLVNKLAEINSNTVMVTNYPILKSQRYKEEEKKYDICFGGGISKQWLHHNILKAMERIENCSFVLCGGSSQEYLGELQKSSAWSKVDYKGMVPHEELDFLYSQSRTGIALLDYVLNAGGKLGTLGNTKLFEYMQAGIPVICTDFVLWREIIDKYECGLYVEPNDINAIVDAILFMKKNPETASEMGKNARKAVENQFNWKTQEEELLSLYSKLDD